MSKRIEGILAAIGRLFEQGEYDDRFMNPKRVSDPTPSTPVVQQRDMIPEQKITLASLEGTPYLTTMADRTAAGGLLQGIGDK